MVVDGNARKQFILYKKAGYLYNYIVVKTRNCTSWIHPPAKSYKSGLYTLFFFTILNLAKSYTQLTRTTYVIPSFDSYTLLVFLFIFMIDHKTKVGWGKGISRYESKCL